jgi:hypothetical protein
MPKNRHAGIHSVISVLIAAFWRGSLERPFVHHIYTHLIETVSSLVSRLEQMSF